MRTKEDAHDYRYFPDPDLLPLSIDEAWIDNIRISLPELPDSKSSRYQESYGLSADDANSLVSHADTAAFFEATLSHCDVSDKAQAAKLIANWMNGELAAGLNREQLEVNQCPVTPESLSALILRIVDNTLSSKLAKQVFDELWRGQTSVDAIIEAKGLKQISDSSEIEALVDQVIAANAQQADDFRNGKEKALNSLVGQVMKLSKGKANPGQVNEILRQKLA